MHKSYRELARFVYRAVSNYLKGILQGCNINNVIKDQSKYTQICKIKMDCMHPCKLYHQNAKPSKIGLNDDALKASLTNSAWFGKRYSVVYVTRIVFAQLIRKKKITGTAINHQICFIYLCIF